MPFYTHRIQKDAPHRACVNVLSDEPSTWMIFDKYYMSKDALHCVCADASSNSPPPWWQISFLSMFFSFSGIEINHGGLSPVNRVGGERRSIPERPNTESQTKLCELGRCHDGETNHPISTILVFSSHILSQSPQNLQVKFLIDSLSRRNEFPVHDSSNIEKNNEHRFNIWPHLSCFFRSRWSGHLPLARSLFGLRVISIAPTFVARDDLRKKVWVTFNLIFQFLAQSKRVFFWFCVSRWGTNFAATHLMFKSTVKICWQELQLTPVASEISSIVYRRSSLIFSQIFSTFSSVWLVDGHPEWGWSSTVISPLLNHANHSKTWVWLSASSLKAFWSTSCASVAIFPRRKQNLRFAVRYGQTSWFRERSLTTLGRILNTSPYKVLRGTSAWLLTREGCNYTHLAGEHSNMIRKSSVLRHHTHAVFRLALPINLTFPHHLTISYRTAVLYEMWSNIGNMLLSPVSPLVWMMLTSHSKRSQQ